MDKKAVSTTKKKISPASPKKVSSKEVPKEEPYQMLKADGFDDCAIGIAERCGMQPVLVYDMEKIVRKLMKRDGMSHEEAQEYFNFNIGGAYMGEGTPMFLIAKINKSNPLDEIADNFT
jgi:hypothetical protein